MNFKKYINSLPSLAGQNIVITGTTSGLGFALSELVLRQGGFLIMANRASSRASAAQEKLSAKYGKDKVITITYDQSDTRTFTAFVKALIDLKLEVNAFIFNAGVYLPDDSLRTDKDLKLTFGVNYFGNYALTEELYEKGLIKHSTRLVYTTSIAAKKEIKPQFVHHMFNNTLQKGHLEYKYAKTALNIFAKELMNTKENNVYLYHPGVTGTNIVRFRIKFIEKLARFFMKLLFPPTNKAALGALFALTTENDGKNQIIVPRGAFNIIGYPKFKALKIKNSAASEALLKLSKEKRAS